MKKIFLPILSAAMLLACSGNEAFRRGIIQLRRKFCKRGPRRLFQGPCDERPFGTRH